jgi:aspartate-semialdehyde dehydrogenase
VQAAIENFQSVPQQRKLPSAPLKPLTYLPQADRPQPRRDAMRENGMGVTVGRIRECPALDIKLVACGHNTIRGAAGAAVLNAELMASEGFLD